MLEGLTVAPWVNARHRTISVPGLGGDAGLNQRAAGCGYAGCIVRWAARELTAPSTAYAHGRDDRLVSCPSEPSAPEIHPAFVPVQLIGLAPPESPSGQWWAALPG